MANTNSERESDLREVDLLLEERSLRLQQVDEHLDVDVERRRRRRKVFNKKLGVLEKKNDDLNYLLETLIADKQLSTFQIVDGVAEKVLELLAERGVRDYDHSDFDEPPEKWVPYVTAKTKKPPNFIHDVYGEFRGLTRADIREIDPELGVAYDNWVSKGGAFPENFSLPDKSGTGLEKPNPYQRYIYQRVNAGIVQKTRKSN